MNELIERIRKHHPHLKDKPIGVVGMHGKAETVNTDSRTLWVVANTADVDCDDEVVVPSGADLAYFNRNKAIFVDHRYTLDQHVATARAIKPVFTGTNHAAWKVHAYVLPLENNRLGNDILTIAREATIGVSIGFEPTDYGSPTPQEKAAYTKGGREPESIVRKWSWVELSFTAMPCNVSCRSSTQTTLETNGAKLEELLTKSLIDKSSAEALGYRVKPMKIKAVCKLS